MSGGGDVLRGKCPRDNFRRGNVRGGGGVKGPWGNSLDNNNIQNILPV